MLAHNPHAALPSRVDLLPPTPRYTPTFPNPSSPSATAKSLRTANVPSPSLPQSEPLSTEAGQYSLSLKGVRGLLRKRGRRAEVVVKLVEDELRSWSGCELGDDEMAGLDQYHQTRGGVSGYGQPRVLDTTMVNLKNGNKSAAIGRSGNTVVPGVNPSDQQELIASTDGEASSSRLPRPFTTSPNSSPQFLSNLLTSLYTTSAGSRDTQRQAVVEVIRAPGHLVWAVADSWERLIVHLLVRYYGLVSFSEYYFFSFRLVRGYRELD